MMVVAWDWPCAKLPSKVAEQHSQTRMASWVMTTPRARVAVVVAVAAEARKVLLAAKDLSMVELVWRW